MALSYFSNARTWQRDPESASDASGRLCYGYLAPGTQLCACPGFLFAGSTICRALGTEVAPPPLSTTEYSAWTHTFSPPLPGSSARYLDR